MKLMQVKIYFTFLFSLFFSVAFAQMSISTNQREDAVWDKETKDWKMVSVNEESATFFEFNEELTMFTHTTKTIQSGYLIKSQEFDKEENTYELVVMSDVGNKYYVTLNIEAKTIEFLAKKKGEIYRVKHSIKHLWFAENKE